MIENRLPRLTWKFAKVNDFDLDKSSDKNSLEEKEISISGEDYQKDLILELDGNNKNYQYNIFVKTESYGKINLFLKNKSSIESLSHVVINLFLESGSELKLCTAVSLNSFSENRLEINAKLEEDSRLDFYNVEFGAKKELFILNTDLLGDGSEIEVHTAYFGDGNDELDLFYNIKHHGQETLSNIIANGALKGNFKKNFRGTIDFLQGSIGSEGNEEEFALLLDDNVKSVAVPLLLCHESEVSGNHAASAGKIDDQLLYYLMSRGFKYEEARLLIVQSKLKPVLEKFDNEEIKNSLLDTLVLKMVNKNEQ